LYIIVVKKSISSKNSIIYIVIFIIFINVFCIIKGNLLILDNVTYSLPVHIVFPCIFLYCFVRDRVFLTTITLPSDSESAESLKTSSSSSSSSSTSLIRCLRSCPRGPFVIGFSSASRVIFNILTILNTDSPCNLILLSFL